ncbi:MAG: hypothetical protein KDA91_25990, partial [Planctomycetaceae bacterium]|nr:hypothetical protein [Planctomycetaceae bacterium]
LVRRAILISLLFVAVAVWFGRISQVMTNQLLVWSLTGTLLFIAAELTFRILKLKSRVKNSWKSLISSESNPETPVSSEVSQSSTIASAISKRHESSEKSTCKSVPASQDAAKA